MTHIQGDDKRRRFPSGPRPPRVCPAGVPRFQYVDAQRAAIRLWRSCLDTLGAEHTEVSGGRFFLTRGGQWLIVSAAARRVDPAVVSLLEQRARRRDDEDPDAPDLHVAVGDLGGAFVGVRRGVFVGETELRSCRCGAVTFIDTAGWWGCQACGADSRTTTPIATNRLEPWPYAAHTDGTLPPGEEAA